MKNHSKTTNPYRQGLATMLLRELTKDLLTAPLKVFRKSSSSRVIEADCLELITPVTEQPQQSF